MSGDDIVILSFAASGLFGGAVLSLRTNAKPILVSIFLATGIAALVFRFLGGIGEATLTVRTLKLGGTMAALIGSAFLINAAFERQARPIGSFSQLKRNDIVGRWKWQWAQGGWLSYLDFTANDETLMFVGYVQQFQNGQWQRVYDLDEGSARIVTGNRLELDCRVKDLLYGGTFCWVSAEPLEVGPVFWGRMIVPSKDPRYEELRHYQWGIAITKETS
jgi:hypothetical protein